MKAEEQFDKLDLDNNLSRLLLKSFLKSHAKDAPDLCARVEARLLEIDKLEEADLTAAKEADTVFAYQSFQQKWNGISISPKAAKVVTDRIAELESQETLAWSEAQKTDTTQAYKSYLKDWPEGANAASASREIEKRAEVFDGLFFTRTGDGTKKLRLATGVPLSLLIFLVVLGPLVGALGFLALGALSLALSFVGAQGLVYAAITMALIIFVFVHYGLGKGAENAGSAVFVIGISTLYAIWLGQWLGLPVSNYMRATGL